MSEVVAPQFERERVASPDNTREQVRTLAIASVVAEGNKGYKNFQETGGNPPPPAEQNTRNWLGYLTNLEEGVHDKPLIGQSADGSPNGKDMFIAISVDSKAVQASADGLTQGTGFENVKLVALKGKKGTTVTVELSDSRIITIPVSVLQEAHLITHQTAHLAGLSPEKRKIGEAYVNTVIAGSGLKIDSLTGDDLKEVAKETPGIKPDAAAAYIENVVHKISTSNEISALTPQKKGAVEAKLKELADLKDRLRQQAVTTVDDMSEMLSLMNSQEITGIAVEDIKKQLNETSIQLAQITNQMLNLSPDSADWKSLNKIKHDLNIQLKDLHIQRNLREKSSQDKSQDIIEDFFERAQNGEFSSDMIDKINSGLKEGNLDEVMETALTEMTKAGKSEAEIEAAKKKMDDLKRKGILIGGGAVLLLFFLFMQAMKEK